MVFIGSGCGSSHRVQETQLEPECKPTDEGFVRTSPNQDANTIVLPGVALPRARPVHADTLRLLMKSSGSWPKGWERVRSEVLLG
jgi:hypothetical protein